MESKDDPAPNRGTLVFLLNLVGVKLSRDISRVGAVHEVVNAICEVEISTRISQKWWLATG